MNSSLAETVESPPRYTTTDTRHYFNDMAGVYLRLWGLCSGWGVFPDECCSLRQGAQNSARQFVDRIPLKTTGPVLDLACGAGGCTALLLEEPARRVVGIDLSEAQLNNARDFLDNGRVELIQGDAHSLPFKTGVFGAALCVSSFFYFQNKDAVIRQVARVLEDGAYFVFDDMIQTPLLTDAEEAEVLNRHRTTSIARAEEYRALLEGSEFTVLEEVDLSEGFVRTYEVALANLPRHRETIFRCCGEEHYSGMTQWFERAAHLGAQGHLGRWMCAAQKKKA